MALKVDWFGHPSSPCTRPHPAIETELEALLHAHPGTARAAARHLCGRPGDINRTLPLPQEFAALGDVTAQTSESWKQSAISSWFAIVPLTSSAGCMGACA